MFRVDGLSMLLTRGDTALLTITAESDHVFTAADRAVYTVKRGSEVIKEETLTPDAGGAVQIAFASSETERWAIGTYKWDIRYVIEAETDAAGRVVDGVEVITPMRPATLEIVEAVGRV